MGGHGACANSILENAHTILFFHIWLMLGPFGLFCRCVGFYIIDLGVSISLKSGLRFWTVYFPSRGDGAFANPLFYFQKLWVQVGPALEPYCVYLDPVSAGLAPYLAHFEQFLVIFGYLLLLSWTWALPGC